MITQNTERCGDGALLTEEIDTDAGAGDGLGQVELSDLLDVVVAALGQLLGILLTVAVVERRLVEVLEQAVAAELGRNARGEMDIRTAELSGLDDHIFYRHMHNSFSSSRNPNSEA